MCYILFCLRRLRAFDGEIMRFVFNLQKYDIFFVWQKVFIKKFNVDVQFCACSVFGWLFSLSMAKNSPLSTISMLLVLFSID